MRQAVAIAKKDMCALISRCSLRTNNFIMFRFVQAKGCHASPPPSLCWPPPCAILNKVMMCLVVVALELGLGLFRFLGVVAVAAFERIVKYMQGKSHDSRDVAHIWAP